MKLREIAVGIVSEQEAENYLRFELPSEDLSREFEPVASGEGCEIWRDADVYLIHTSVGLDTGMWDNLTSDYPAVANIVELASR